MKMQKTVSLVVRAAYAMGMLLSPATGAAQAELGFLAGVFSRVHRLSLSLQSASPQGDLLKTNNSACFVMSICGAGTEVLIDLDSRSSRIDLELGFGAGYLRPVRSKDASVVDIRAAVRSLPVISTHVTYLTDHWVHPYFRASFGLVDLWNARAHTVAGKQGEVKASTFEYGVGAGASVATPWTNARLLLEAGYRARSFSSIGYSFTDALPNAFPRELNLSAWQVSAGWQFDLRPLNKAPSYEGMWVLTKVDGLPIPTVIRQERQSPDAVRDEIVGAYLDLQGDKQYTLEVVVRKSIVTTNGVAIDQRFAEPIREAGEWTTKSSVELSLTGSTWSQRAARIDEELMLESAATGRRLFFRRVKR